MNDQRFPRAARIRSGREIRRLLRTGTRYRIGALELFVAEASEPRPRVGFIVPRHGHSAVERNRLRRRLKEIARREWLPEAGRHDRMLDVVVRASREAYEPTFDELRGLLDRAANLPCCSA